MRKSVTQKVINLECKNTIEHYDLIYSHASGIAQSGPTLHDISKARSRIRSLCDYFCLNLAKKKCLDVGSGFGYYTDALSNEVGAFDCVIGLDASSEATKIAKVRFQNINFITGFFPDAVAGADFFDLIIAIDLSLINIFDANKINLDFVCPAMDMLRPGGQLVIGWHTNFSGDYRDGWCHWSQEHFRAIADECGLSDPVIVQARLPIFSRAAIRICRLLRKSAPVFMIRKK